MNGARPLAAGGKGTAKFTKSTKKGKGSRSKPLAAFCPAAAEEAGAVLLGFDGSGREPLGGEESREEAGEGVFCG